MNLKTKDPLVCSLLLLVAINLLLCIYSLTTIWWTVIHECHYTQIIIIEPHYIYVPEELKPPKEEVKVVEQPVIPPKYGFTDDDIYLMTVLLCGSKNNSGDGEYDIDFGNQDDHDQISLVLSVVMNRVMSAKFPDTVEEVIWAPKQFSPMARWSKNNLPEVKPESYEIVKAWCKEYDSHNLAVMSVPETHLYFTGNGKINISRKGW